MNRLEELFISIFIISILIILNLGYAFTNPYKAVGEYDILYIYSSIQRRMLGDEVNVYSMDEEEIYVVVVANGSIIYEYGDPELVSSDPIILPIFVDGILGEMRCWLGERG